MSASTEISLHHLGFRGASGKQPMETEAGGSCLARGKKRPPSPAGSDEELSEPIIGDDDDEWLASASSGEDGEDHENQGTHGPYTVVDFPRATWDYDAQDHIVYMDPNIELRGPPPIQLFPPFQCGKNPFVEYYNLCDTTEITVTSASVTDCPTTCKCKPMNLLQFIDIKIAGYHHTQPGPARIYGFVAARDTIKPLRNYVYRREIGNYEAVTVKRNTGMARLSLTSPTRVISMVTRAMIEFELYVRTEDQPEPKGDCLIKGCTEFTNMFSSKSFVEQWRLYGPKCALDVKFAVLINAMEARINIKVLHLGAIASGVNLKVYAKTSGFREVIQLFQGAAPEPGVVMNFVVAAEVHNYLHLYIKASPGDNPVHGEKEEPVPCSWWRCGYGSGFHCADEDVAELGQLAAVSVKIEWKTYPSHGLYSYS